MPLRLRVRSYIIDHANFGNFPLIDAVGNVYKLHKPEFPRVRLPTQAFSEMGSLFPAQDDADATNALRQPHPWRKKCAESLVPIGTFFRSRGPKDPHE